MQHSVPQRRFLLSYQLSFKTFVRHQIWSQTMNMLTSMLTFRKINSSLMFGGYEMPPKVWSKMKWLMKTRIFHIIKRFQALSDTSVISWHSILKQFSIHIHWVHTIHWLFIAFVPALKYHWYQLTGQVNLPLKHIKVNPLIKYQSE